MYRYFQSRVHNVIKLLNSHYCNSSITLMAGWGGGIRFASIQSRKVPGTAIGLSRSNPTHQIRVVTTPKRCHNNPGWGGGIRTPECQDTGAPMKPVSWGREPGALPLGHSPL